MAHGGLSDAAVAQLEALQLLLESQQPEFQSASAVCEAQSAQLAALHPYNVAPSLELQKRQRNSPNPKRRVASAAKSGKPAAARMESGGASVCVRLASRWPHGRRAQNLRSVSSPACRPFRVFRKASHDHENLKWKVAIEMSSEAHIWDQTSSPATAAKHVQSSVSAIQRFQKGES